MNISRDEQRVLHALAMGGLILVEKDDRRKVARVDCKTRDGWTLSGCDTALFARLKKRRFIRSRNGGPYEITRVGLAAVRAEFAQR